MCHGPLGNPHLPEVHSLHDKERDYVVFDITQEGCMHAFLTQLAEREEAVNNSQEHHDCELSGKNCAQNRTCRCFFFAAE